MMDEIKSTEILEMEQEAAILDYLGLQEHMAPVLREGLEATIPHEAGEYVLALVMLAIKYGRALGNRDALLSTNVVQQQKVFPLFPTVEPTASKIIIVPAHVDLKHRDEK